MASGTIVGPPERSAQIVRTPSMLMQARPIVQLVRVGRTVPMGHWCVNARTQAIGRVPATLVPTVLRGERHVIRATSSRPAASRRMQRALSVTRARLSPTTAPMPLRVLRVRPASILPLVPVLRRVLRAMLVAVLDKRSPLHAPQPQTVRVGVFPGTMGAATRRMRVHRAATGGRPVHGQATESMRARVSRSHVPPGTN